MNTTQKNEMLNQLQVRITDHIHLSLTDDNQKNLVKHQIVQMFSDTFIEGWETDVPARFSFLAGRIMSTIESLGGQESRQKALKKLCLHDSYNVQYTLEGSEDDKPKTKPKKVDPKSDG